MNIKEIIVTNHIIRVVGIIDELDSKGQKKYINKLKSSGYKIDNGLQFADKIQVVNKFYRDNYYPNFRNIMFFDDSKNGNYRLTFDKVKSLSLLYRQQIPISIHILKSEIYCFSNHVGLFSLSIKLTSSDVRLEELSNLLSVVRNFDTNTDSGHPWHQWISNNILCDLPLRGDHVKSDEYSGSKFKLFNVFDVDLADDVIRKHILFDLATASPLGSASGETLYTPDNLYYEALIKNRIAAFKNWEGLPLMDSLTYIGKGILQYQDSWDITYFRIYLYRLFFKYNLYKYNSAIVGDGQDAIKLRGDFEDFLNLYDFSYISYNFLPNLMYKNIGEALDLDDEMLKFRNKITDLSNKIEEERQSKTNLLLQIVTVLGGISSLGPVVDFLKNIQVWLGLTSTSFYSYLAVIVIIIGISVLYYLNPKKFKLFFNKCK
jgi:hypothetical protein